jgi:hypothetical protein
MNFSSLLSFITTRVGHGGYTLGQQKMILDHNRAEGNAGIRSKKRAIENPKVY